MKIPKNVCRSCAHPYAPGHRWGFSGLCRRCSSRSCARKEASH